MNLDKLRQDAAAEWGKITNPSKVLIFIGMGTCGKSAGAEDIEIELSAYLEKKNINYEIVRVGCIGLCHMEPLVDVVKPSRPRISFGKVTKEDIRKIVDGYILLDEIPRELVIGTIGDKRIDGIPGLLDIPFMKHQVRRILARCGFIDPENIYHYAANGGYSGLEKALNMPPEEVIEEIKKSGLRGRGGAGFPTGQKWSACRKAKPPKYLICNADEGDPGAFMNRALMESDPHSVLEGMLIAGYAIGAEKAYVYCRAEYPLALQRLNTAIGKMCEFNLLGGNILGTDFRFDIFIKEGAGAFVCGEETALISSIEGKRGMPKPKPPFPVEKGLYGMPTVINNVETFANVPAIIKNGHEWFTEYGTEKSKGTKTFCLVGKIKNTGLIEVPFGTALKRVIYDIGGGIADDKEFKALQIGGPSGGCIPANLLNLTIDYESLTGAGAIMGSGGMIIIDKDNCAVDLARYFLTFTQNESCGKCVPCRVGTKQMLNILKKITSGSAKMEDLAKLMELSNTIQSAALCGLGKTAPNPVLTTIKYFYDEYLAHIREKKCPAKICKPLIKYSILADKCTGCHICFKQCAQNAITGEPKKAHAIAQDKCSKCGICYDVCKFDAVKVE